MELYLFGHQIEKLSRSLRQPVKLDPDNSKFNELASYGILTNDDTGLHSVKPLTKFTPRHNTLKKDERINLEKIISKGLSFRKRIEKLINGNLDTRLSELFNQEYMNDLNTLKVMMDLQESLDDLQALWESSEFQESARALNSTEFQQLINFKDILKLKFKREYAYRK